MCRTIVLSEWRSLLTKPGFCTVSQKTVQNCFCQNFVNFAPILIIFGRKLTKRLKLYQMHSFSTSPNSHHHTTMLNADVPNCYTTLKVFICNKLFNDLINNDTLKCGLFSRIINQFSSKLSELCSRCAPRTQTQVLRRQCHRKCEAAFAA